MSTTQETTNRADREKLKTYFETGDRPTEEEFSQTIDSWINQLDDDLHAVDQKIGIGTDEPESKLHIKSAGGDADTVGIVQIESTSPSDSGSLSLGVDPGENTWIQSNDDHIPLHINPKKNNTVLNAENGNVGVGGLGSPDHKLHVEGDLAVTNHIYGNKTNEANDADVLFVNNGSQVQLFGARHTGKSGAIVLGALKNPHNPNSGKILFSQNLGNGSWQENAVIDTEGKMGIGTTAPQNKLHVHQTGNSATTGLTLSGQSGANTGDILTLDGSGNAKWLPPTSVTNGLWKKIGSTDHIENGNLGNVGIGTNVPKEKLHVAGNIQVQGDIIGKDAGGALSIFSARNNAGAYMHLHSSTLMDSSNASQPHSNQGGITFVASAGTANKNGFKFMQNNPVNAPHWPTCLSIDGNRNSYFWNNKIYLRHEGDKNHGIGFVSADVFDNEPNKMNGLITNTVVDGPFVFGYQGGALGTNQTGSQNIALQWFRNKSVDFKGKLTTKNFPLLVKKYYSFKSGETIKEQVNGSITAGDANDKFIIRDYPPSLYEAIIGNFSYNHFNAGDAGGGQVQVWIEKHGDNNEWALVVRFPNSHNSEKMVDVFFVRKELF